MKEQMEQIDETPHPDLWFRRGAFSASTGHDRNALAYFSTAFASRPGSVLAWIAVAYAPDKMGHSIEAARSCDTALGIAPDCVEGLFVKAWFNKGVNYISLSKFGDAARCFDRCLALNPGHSSMKVQGYHTPMRWGCTGRQQRVSVIPSRSTRGMPYSSTTGHLPEKDRGGQGGRGVLHPCVDAAPAS